MIGTVILNALHNAFCVHNLLLKVGSSVIERSGAKPVLALSPADVLQAGELSEFYYYPVEVDFGV